MADPVTTLTARWQGDPAALRRALRVTMEALTRCSTVDALADIAGELDLTLAEVDAAHLLAHDIVAAASDDPVLRVQGFELTEGLGVAVATKGGES